MRTNTLLISGTSALLIVGSVLLSCQKNDDLKTTSTTERRSANVASLEDLINKDDIELAAFFTSQSTSAEDLATKNCLPVITYDNPPGVYPRTVTTDWGTANCFQPKTGLTRRGKVITIYYGDMADTTALSYYEQRYEDYYVNDVKIEGEQKVAHNSRNKDPQNVYRMTFNNRKATQPNGVDYTIMNGSKRMVKQEDDGEYPGPLRFTGNFRLTGIVTGDVLEGGASYQWIDSIDLDNPLIYDNCEFIVKGNLFIDFNNQSDWFINYGDSLICDDQAELTIDGVTQTITLPFYRTDDY